MLGRSTVNSYNGTAVAHEPVTDTQTKFASGGLATPAGIPANLGNDITINLNNIYSWNGPVSGTVTTEDSTFYPKNYPIKIAPTQDGSTKRLSKGDLCFSCYTESDIKNQNDIYTIYSVSRLNAGSFQKSLRKKADADDGGWRNSKRYRGAGINSILDGDRYLQHFPTDVQEFVQHWRWAGVLQQKTPDDKTSLIPVGVPPLNMDNLFRIASMAIADNVTVPCLMTENVQVGKRMWEVASMSERTYNRSYDEMGRTLGHSVNIPCFHVAYVCTDDDSCPTFHEYTAQIESDIELFVSDVDPLTGQKRSYETGRMPMKIKTLHEPMIRPLGVITEFECGLPTRAEVFQALTDDTKYKKLLGDSPIGVHLYTQGWGPYNLRR